MLHDLLVPPLHRHIPNIITDMLRLHFVQEKAQKMIFTSSLQRSSAQIQELEGRNQGRIFGSHPPMSGSVDVVLRVAHHAEHPGDDSQWKNGFQPKQFRHRRDATGGFHRPRTKPYQERRRQKGLLASHLNVGGLTTVRKLM